MVGNRADAMLEVMDEVMDGDMHEARHEGQYGRIEVITGRRQRRNWTDEEKARIPAESAGTDVNISVVAKRWGVNRGLLNVWRREAGLTSQRSAKALTQQALFVPMTVVGDRTSCESSPSDVTPHSAGRIEIEIAGARMTMIGDNGQKMSTGSILHCSKCIAALRYEPWPSRQPLISSC
ncbi:transposase [Rhizobium leguminosarum]|uniref:transposase n=1 Tax=Rhizobium leguminosarum TaxID=384 RepID=UPI001C96BBCD|nr:transposase [Rhizobium leguminosarum]MBY5454178.1 transposase [Rhizobium leguminosarum]